MEISQNIAAYDHFIGYAYALSTLILGWMAVRSILMLKRAKEKLKKAESFRKPS